MKVGFVFDDSLDRNDGVQQYVRTLGAFYTSQGHEVRYLVGETTLQEWAGGKIYSMSKNLQASFNKNRMTTPLPVNHRKVTEILTDEKFDVLHVQLPCSPFMSGHVVRAAGPATVIVGTFHIVGASRLVNVANRFLGVSLRHVLRHFGQIWSVSSAAQIYARTYYGITSEIAPNVVDLAAFKVARSSTKVPPRTPGRHRLVFLGRLVERKGACELMQAVGHLMTQAPELNLELIVAGDGHERPRLEQLAMRLGLAERTTFMGFIDEKDKAPLLASADLAVFPSLYGESFGIVLLEAMAAGAGVVVGGNNPGYASVLEPWPEALVHPRDSKTFGLTLAKLLKDDLLRDRMHKEQQAAVRQYDVAKVGAELLSAYDKLAVKLKVGV